MPKLVLGEITFEMVEGFLFHLGDEQAFQNLLPYGRNFTVMPEWDSSYDEEGAIYQLKLTMTIFAVEGKQGSIVNIPINTALWNAILDASKIVESVIRTPFPRGYLFGGL